jgi:hypothetical protein
MYFRITALTICLLSTTSTCALAASPGDQQPLENSNIVALTSQIAPLEGSVTETPAPEGDSASATVAVAEAPVYRPIDIVIHDMARGYEDVYRRFVRGVLIYKQGTAEEVRLPIAALENPLDGVFDLSRCGDTGKHLSIATGYRKAKKAENVNKLEIWFAPWFLMKQHEAKSAAHYGSIMEGWDAARAPVGIFYNWGEWDNLAWFDYLTDKSIDDVGLNNLYENCRLTADTQDALIHGRTYRLRGLQSYFTLRFEL